ncbi:acyl transferase [Reichenbachiella carrageenanivorans]|uniref:Acyl transferase n=1 Tax=Reichenbachiella carrageenanivorans TaxID=2979869 RepID=A0ABY6CYC9_9BACT|nr:acyl transferase [Reichenbachiella carrageenanivorans]UXX78878.1 acyl transferase [Reichenbachiella carrageenanivorans]
MKELTQIPFLPVDFFKHHEVKTGHWIPQEVYMSSGTTTSIRSRHYIEDAEFYLNNTKEIFEKLYQPLHEQLFFALLPSYQEQGNSSLVKMVDYFISQSQSDKVGGFYLDRTAQLITDLSEQLQTSSRSIVLFGVGYALLDMVEHVKRAGVRLDGLTIIETGGMKGRRKDMVKSEFYALLKEGMGDVKIQSEYGMTELLSQAYSFNEVSYCLPKQMKVLIRDPEDPFSYLASGRTGGVNIIDLANVHSCAFIETSDLGRLTSEGEFEVLGRLDNSEIRGCNLMVL